METTLYTLAGSSGVGKSTQVLFLHEFIKHAGYNIEDYICENTGLRIGYFCKELNLVYLGEDVYRDGKNSIMRWQGIDNIGRKRIGANCKEQFKVIYGILEDHDVVVESMMHSVLPALRPKQLEENTKNVTRVVVRNYHYESFDERDARTEPRRSIKGVKAPQRNELNKGHEGLFMRDPSDRVKMDYTCIMVKDLPIYDLTLKIFNDKGIDKEKEIKEFASSIDPIRFNLNERFRRKGE